MLIRNKNITIGKKYAGSRQISYPQSGMTAIGVIIILMMLGFFFLLLITLFPIYVENYKVSSHLNKLSEETGVAKMSDNKIIETLFRRFDIDDIENVKVEDVLIEEDNDGITITVEYEVRTNAMANIDVVVSFSEAVVIQ